MDDILDAAQTNNPPNAQSVIDSAAPPPAEAPPEPAPEPIKDTAPLQPTPVEPPQPPPEPTVTEPSLIVPPPPPPTGTEPPSAPAAPATEQIPEPPPDKGVKPAGSPPTYKPGGKKSNWKILVAGVLLLILTLPLLVVFTRQQQEIRSRATGGVYPTITTTPNPSCTNATPACGSITPPTCFMQNSGPTCDRNVQVGLDLCAGLPCNPNGTTGNLTPTPSPGACVSYSIVNGNQMTNCTGCTGTNAGTCTPGTDQFMVVCTCNADQLDSNGYCGFNCHQVTGSASCSDLAAQTCQTVQLDLKTVGEGQNTFSGTIDETVICQPPAGCTPPTPTTPPSCTGADCNPPTPTPTPAAPQCVNIKAYKGAAVLNAAGLQALKSGDVVTLAHAASGATKARFRINGTTDADWIETTSKNASNEFTLEWTVPTATAPANFTIEAQSFSGTAWE